MKRVIPHYRAECVADFQLAQEGEINLAEYAEKFMHKKEIQNLQHQLQKVIKQGISLQNSEEVAAISRLLEHEFSRALFPYRYIRYGTSIFGSARLQAEDPEFLEVTEIAKGIVSESRVDIITGGGPGVMEAASQGLKEAEKKRQKAKKKNGARNNGILVKLPFEEIPNSHIDVRSSHSTFGTRLNEFSDKSNSTISWDGGGGTDLENSFVFQLKQVGHIEADFPIILKKRMWEAIQEAKMNAMYYERVAEQKRPLISPQDISLMTLVDHPDDAIQAVLNHYQEWKRQVWSKLDQGSQEDVLKM